MIYDSIIAILSLPAAVIMSCSARGRRRLKERFGFWEKYPENAIWIHAASMGEVQGIIPLIKELKSKISYPVLVTATSVTGLQRVQGLVDEAFLLPFDSGIYLRHIVRRIKPKAFIFSETELWPGILRLLGKNNVPRFMINARVTTAAWKQYKKLNFLFRDVLSGLDYVAASESGSLERLQDLGAPRERSAVVGNTKYDFSVTTLSTEQKGQLRNSLFIDEKPVVVLGSLRPGEESIWFEALKKCAALDIVCIIVPRHQEKLPFFQQKLAEYGLSFALRSAIQQHAKNILVDTMGELVPLYQIANGAFIGATLVDNLGGHNPLEAAIFGTPLALGPYGEVIAEIRAALDANDAYEKVTTLADATSFLRRIAERNQNLMRAGEKAELVAKSFQGATGKVLEILLPKLT